MSPERGGPAAGDGQHYESFIVRVRLNDDGSIRDTRMEHVRTGEVRRWAGWEHNAMLGFVREAASPAALPVLLAAPVVEVHEGECSGSRRLGIVKQAGVWLWRRANKEGAAGSRQPPPPLVAGVVAHPQPPPDNLREERAITHRTKR